MDNLERTIKSYNPATGELLGEVPNMTGETISEIVQKVATAGKMWQALSIKERIVYLQKVKNTIIENTDELCKLISQENGKTVFEALSFEVIIVPYFIDYFCREAQRALENQSLSIHLFKHRKSYVHYKPLGIHCAISPWNYPFFLPVSMIIAPLLAGNSVILKPSSLTPLTAKYIEKIFVTSGFPENVLSVVTTSGENAFNMISMEEVKSLTFIGSTAVGKKVAAECGRNLIPCAMELGGNNPAIVARDADIELATGAITMSAFGNAGQTCAACGRVYVEEAIYDVFVERLFDRVHKIHCGNPLDYTTSMGAITDSKSFELFESAIKDAQEKGAQIAVGGKRITIDGRGNFFEPTVITNATQNMIAVTYELFGPILPIVKVKNIDEAITYANDSVYGLSAYVFSQDAHKAKKIAEQVVAGNVIINESFINNALPDLPWGGEKQSGIGRIYTKEHLRQFSHAYHVHYDAIPFAVSQFFWAPYSKKMYSRIKRYAQLFIRSGWLEKFTSFLRGH